MRQYIFKFSLLLFCFSFIGLSPLSAQSSQKTKTVKKSYKIKQDSRVEISNKYGHIHVNTWNKDSVKFEVLITATSKNDEKASNVLNFIQIDFVNTNYYTIAKTDFKNYKNQFWQEVTDLANTIFATGSVVQIDYRVWVPQKAHLKITNKFGNVYLTNHTGDVDIVISNGDLQANDLTGFNNLKIDFGRASIRTVKRGKLEINYSELDIEECGNVNFDTRSSEIRIEKAGDIFLDTRRDKYYIQKVKSISGSASFSFINVNHLGDNLKMKTRYGNTNVEELDSRFRFIDIDSYYTDIFIYLEKGTNARCEIIHSDKTVIQYEDKYKLKKKKLENPVEEKKLKTYGDIGTTASGKSKINISTVGGTIKIFNK